MQIEQYLKGLPWGGKFKLSKFLKVSTATVAKYSRPVTHFEKLFPTPEKAKLIENFSLENPEWGHITLEDILGEERATEVRAIWAKNHGG